MIELIVSLVGIAGLTLTALLLAREPDARIRLVVLMGAPAGFVLACLIALLAGKSVIVALATATLGAATLALVLLGQWLLIRWIGNRQQPTGNRTQ
jgi:hypothetical protein